MKLRAEASRFLDEHFGGAPRDGQWYKARQSLVRLLVRIQREERKRAARDASARAPREKFATASQRSKARHPEGR